MVIRAIADTNILIDLLRGFPPSVAWYRVNTDIAITAITVLELIEGATNSRDQAKIVKIA